MYISIYEKSTLLEYYRASKILYFEKINAFNFPEIEFTKLIPFNLSKSFSGS